MRRDSDVVQAWIDDCCTVGTDLRIARSEAYDSFKKYCEEEERQALTRNGFFRALRTKNLTETKDAKGIRQFCEISVKKVPLESAESAGFMTVTDEQLAELPFTQ